MPIDDQLVNSIKEMAKSLERPLSSNEYCIYRIPTWLRKLNGEAYTPKIISIRHFHHGSKRLEPMEKLKLKYFQRFLRRINDLNIESLVNAIKLHEERARDCYAETINLSIDDFVKVILLDGSFIIELFYVIQLQGEDDVICENHILLNPILWEAMEMDLLLLENQLPFFVLEILFSLAYAPNDDEYPSFISLAIKVFENIKDQEFPGDFGEQPIWHFVDLTKAFFLPSSKKQVLPRESNDLPRADHLYTASYSSKCLLDFKSNGILEIPYMELSNEMETIYRNIIAFEQCHYPHDTHFKNYIVLLNFLINTSKDAELLIRKGIIMNALGNNDSMTSLFNNLDMNIVYYSEEYAYRGLFRDLNAFYRNTKHTWKATLKHDYFGIP
ncbi:hypothetical protein CIPAW_08G153600 [Carya illinoinensis]|uniref:Uncharacterized protein n=2 Tax=Carya illinoinensis TaxID=32201 RepID=A0A8T1PW75_CARIL|nr:hypothetical protein CIPAW_08G153600 [Carya illinoinensis]